MSLQVEMLEKSMAKLTIEVSADDFEKAVEKVYLKNRGKMVIQGFRKGKAPRNIIEKFYGEEVFFEDAANLIMPDAYEKELEDCDVEIVSQPEIDVVQIGKNKSFIFTAKVAVKPEVSLGEYKGIKVKKTNIEVTDEEVEQKIEAAREQNSRTVPVESRAAQMGDIATIDFEGFVDGEAFEGGKASDFALTLGSHSFIDNFEDQIVGKNVSDKFDVNVTFPEDYQAKELAGKPALFKVEIKELKAKELPDVDDEFVQDVSEFDTLDEYKADLRKSIEEKKIADAKTEKEEQVIKTIIDNATMEIPKPMQETQVRQIVDDFARKLQAQGLTLEQYMQFTGMNGQQFKDSVEPQAMKRIQSRLVLEAIVAAEDIKVSDEEFEENIKQMAETYKMEIEKIKELVKDKEKEAMIMDIAVQKAVDLVVDAAVEE